MAEGGNQTVDDHDDYADVALGLLDNVLFDLPCKHCGEMMFNHRELVYCLFDSGGHYTDPDGKTDLSLTAQQHARLITAGLHLVRHQRELEKYPRLKKFLENWNGDGPTEVG